MIALISHGWYSDYTVDILLVDAPWEAYAWAWLMDRFGCNDGCDVESVIDGTVVCGRDAGAKIKGTDLILDYYLRATGYDPSRAGRKNDVDLTGIDTFVEGTGKHARIHPTESGFRQMMWIARMRIESECAEKGVAVPWKVPAGEEGGER